MCTLITEIKKELRIGKANGAGIWVCEALGRGYYDPPQGMAKIAALRVVDCLGACNYLTYKEMGNH